MDELGKESDAAECLVCRLNADILLDTRVMEALKLHGLSAALNLQLADSLGDALPCFALQLFASSTAAGSPSSSGATNSPDVSVNYINAVGDSTVLQRVSRNVSDPSIDFDISLIDY